MQKFKVIITQSTTQPKPRSPLLFLQIIYECPKDNPDNSKDLEHSDAAALLSEILFCSEQFVYASKRIAECYEENNIYPLEPSFNDCLDEFTRDRNFFDSMDFHQIMEILYQRCNSVACKVPSECKLANSRTFPNVQGEEECVAKAEVSGPTLNSNPLI